MTKWILILIINCTLSKFDRNRCQITNNARKSSSYWKKTILWMCAQIGQKIIKHFALAFLDIFRLQSFNIGWTPISFADSFLSIFKYRQSFLITISFKVISALDLTWTSFRLIPRVNFNIVGKMRSKIIWSDSDFVSWLIILNERNFVLWKSVLCIALSIILSGMTHCWKALKNVFFQNTKNNNQFIFKSMPHQEIN